MTENLGRIVAHLAEPTEVYPNGLVELINLNVSPPTPVALDDVYVRAMYVVSDQVNSFGGRFPVDDHKRLSGLLVDSPVLIGHRKDQGSLLAVVRTNSAGAAPVNLDADSFVVVATAPGYLFTPFDTVVVTGPETDTILGYHIDPGSPASPSLCRVYGFLYTVAGEPEPDAAVSAYLPKGVTHSGSLIVSPFAVFSTTDSTGYFYLDLIPSDSLSDDSNRYVITISRTDGSVLRKRILVPAAGSWQLMW